MHAFVHISYVQNFAGPCWLFCLVWGTFRRIFMVALINYLPFVDSRNMQIELKYLQSMDFPTTNKLLSLDQDPNRVKNLQSILFHFKCFVFGSETKKKKEKNVLSLELGYCRIVYPSLITHFLNSFECWYGYYI